MQLKENYTKELVESVEKRLQFVMVLALFFPTFLETVFKLSKSSEVDSSRTVLNYSFSICFLIGTYFFFELRKVKIRSVILKIFNVIFLVFPLAFVIIIYIAIKYQNSEPLSFYDSYLLKGSFLTVLFLPIVSFTILVAEIAFKIGSWLSDQFAKFFSIIKNKRT